MSILLTGAAGFIGFHVAKALLDRGEEVIGVDNLNDYYDVRLKEARLDQLRADRGFTFAKLDVADRYYLCLVLLGVRCQSAAAVQRRTPRRPAGVALCRNQAQLRAFGPHLQSPLQSAGNRTAVLYRVWSVGAARHGRLSVHRRYP